MKKTSYEKNKRWIAAAGILVAVVLFSVIAIAFRYNMMPNSSDVPAVESTSIPSNWTTYKGPGFAFSYPADWVLTEYDDDGWGGLSVSLETPDTEQLISDRQIDPSYKYNLALHRFADINNSYAQGGEGPETRYDYKSVEEFLDDTAPKAIKKIGDMVIDGVPAHEVIVGGYGQAYGVFIEREELLLFVFERADDKSLLGNEEKKILNSLEFFGPQETF